MAVASCIACGAETHDDTAPLEGVADQTVDVCIECETPPAIEQNIQQPTPMVLAFPARLMFYGDVSAQSGLAPQTVTVRNNTPSALLVRDAYIINVETPPGTESTGAEFFSLETPSLDAPLSTYDELELVVSFARSSEQQEALLVIETTHQSFPTLVVELSGKYFLW